MAYLNYTDDAAYEGKTKREKPSWMKENYVECKKCRGYGGWILKLNSYGPSKHFEASCADCNGHGFVHISDANCIHQWDSGENIGRCLTKYTCTKCKKQRTIDSSD